MGPRFPWAVAAAAPALPGSCGPESRFSPRRAPREPHLPRLRRCFCPGVRGLCSCEERVWGCVLAQGRAGSVLRGSTAASPLRDVRGRTSELHFRHLFSFAWLSRKI